MLALVLTGLLYLALLLVLATSGFPAQLAAMDWLLLAGLVLVAVITGILIYRGGLRGWVREGGHPASLRLFAVLASTLLWFVVFLGRFWAPAAASFPGTEGGPLGTVILGVILAAAALLLFISYATRRRIGRG